VIFQKKSNDHTPSGIPNDVNTDAYFLKLV